MSAAHVRRGSSGRSRTRKAPSRGSVTKRIASKLPVEEAQASTAQVQRLADQVTRYFVPAVVGVAFLAFAGWWIAATSRRGCSPSSPC